MMLYTVMPTELVMLNLQPAENTLAECKTDQPQAVLSTNPQDFLAATQIKLRK